MYGTFWVSMMSLRRSPPCKAGARALENRQEPRSSSQGRGRTTRTEVMDVVEFIWLLHIYKMMKSVMSTYKIGIYEDSKMAARGRKQKATLL
jgi:hypothetical protein